jgi:superfamily I DNA and/or RNA helicase
MLEEQYRMHPSICKFPSASFYGKKLLNGSVGPFFVPRNLFWPKKFADEKEFDRMEKKQTKGYERNDFESFRIVFFNVKGVESKLSVTSSLGGEKSARNDDEIKYIKKLFNHLLENGVEQKDIKILSPYRSQVVGIASNLKINDTNVSTVITSQGGEWNYV